MEPFAHVCLSVQPTILKMETLFLDQGNVTGPTSLIQSNVDPLQHYYEVEFALPFDKGLQVSILVLERLRMRNSHCFADVFFKVSAVGEKKQGTTYVTRHFQAFAELRSLIREAQKWECPYYCNQSISVRFSAADTAYLRLDAPHSAATFSILSHCLFEPPRFKSRPFVRAVRCSGRK